MMMISWNMDQGEIAHQDVWGRNVSSLCGQVTHGLFVFHPTSELGTDPRGPMRRDWIKMRVEATSCPKDPQRSPCHPYLPRLSSLHLAPAQSHLLTTKTLKLVLDLNLLEGSGLWMRKKARIINQPDSPGIKVFKAEDVVVDAVELNWSDISKGMRRGLLLGFPELLHNFEVGEWSGELLSCGW